MEALAVKMEALSRRVVGSSAKVVSASNSSALRTPQESPSGRALTYPLAGDVHVSQRLAELERKAR